MTLAKTTKEYFEEWHPYDLLIKHNYMRHVEMIDCLRAQWKASNNQMQDILELGCGNAFALAKALKGFKPIQYTGVDLSKTALEDAAQNLAELDGEFELIESDIRTACAALGRDYDLIVAGFCLHHFSSDENLQILKDARQRLREGGQCIVYDIVTRGGEKREAYIDRLVEGVKTREMNMSAGQLESIVHHITHYDYPISQEAWNELAMDAGFNSVECKYRDPEEHYAFLRFS